VHTSVQRPEQARKGVTGVTRAVRLSPRLGVVALVAGLLTVSAHL
jgi:hypothetical protein